MISKSKIQWVSILGLTLVYSLTSCYEHPEGCMDVRAANYDVKADQPCDDCCKYPELKLTVSHFFEGSPADTGTFLVLEDVPDVRIRSLTFYVSDIKLLNGTNDSESTIEEFISVGNRSGNLLSYYDTRYAVAKIKFGPTKTISLGTFKNADLYKGIQMNFGISEEINHSVMDKISSSHALYTKTSDGMYLNESDGYYFLKMELQLEDQSFRTITIQGDDLFRMMALENDFDFRSRTIRTIQMGIEYKSWFGGIDFHSDSDSAIQQKMSDQFKFSVSFL